MPRKKMTLAELQLRGSLKKNKTKYLDRLIPQVPTPAVQVSTLEPPRNLRAAEKSAFREIAEARPWLSPADRIQVELAASLTCRMRNVKTPATRADLALLQRVLNGLDKRNTQVPQPVVTQPVVPEMTEDQKFTFALVSGNLIPFHDMTEAEQTTFRLVHPNMVSLDADKFCSPLYHREEVDYWRQHMAKHVLWRRAHLRRSGTLDESDWSHAAKHGDPTPICVQQLAQQLEKSKDNE